jgi:hypothetical protein
VQFSAPLHSRDDDAKNHRERYGGDREKDEDEKISGTHS